MEPSDLVEELERKLDLASMDRTYSARYRTTYEQRITELERLVELRKMAQPPAPEDKDR